MSGIQFSDTSRRSVGNPVGNLGMGVGNEREVCREPRPEPVPDTRERRSLSLSGTPGVVATKDGDAAANGDGAKTARAVPASGAGTGARDPLVAALARFVEALHARYPDGPDQMQRESLDARGNMRRMRKNDGGRAA